MSSLRRVEDPVAYDEVPSSEYRLHQGSLSILYGHQFNSHPARRTNSWELVLRVTFSLTSDDDTLTILGHQGFTWIDFERAEFVHPRTILGTLSPNRQR